MGDLIRAIGKAIISLFHPRMLWLAVWPFLLALVFWGVLAWACFDQVQVWLRVLMHGVHVVDWIDAFLSWLGIVGFRSLLEPLVFLALLIPLIVLSALLILAFVAAPAVVRHVGQRDYPDVAMQGGGVAASLGSLLNALWATLIFATGWLLTLPLWLIVPLAVILPVFWMGWLNARVLRYDVLVEHATAQERSQLIQQNHRPFLVLGIMTGMLNFVPPFFFVAPIFSTLAMTHFALNALRRLRNGGIGKAGPHASDPAREGIFNPYAGGNVIDMGPVDEVAPEAQANPARLAETVPSSEQIAVHPSDGKPGS